MGRSGQTSRTSAITRNAEFRRHEGLPEIWMQPLARPISEFLRDDSDYFKLVVDPPYQRGDVWTVEQRRMMIQSLLMGIPLNAIYLNVRGNDGPEVYVVDGRQRITTLRMFVNDEFSIPADWLPAADRKVDLAIDNELVWSEIELPRQRKIKMQAIATYETRLATEEEEAELFQLLNFAGTDHVRPDDTDQAEPLRAKIAEIEARLVELDRKNDFTGIALAKVERYHYQVALALVTGGDMPTGD